MPISAAPEIENTDYYQTHFGIESPFSYKLRRLDQGDQRWYMYTDEALDIRYCMSATTFSSMSLGIGIELAKYMQEMGKAAADLHKYYAAEYGTFFHIEASKALRAQEYDFGANGFVAEMRVTEWMEKKKIPMHEKWYFLRRFYKDMASLLMFMEERNVKLIGVEFPLVSYKYDLACCVDLIAEMDWQGTRKNIILDFKTGAHFFKEHVLQLELYRMMWNEHFGDIIPVDLIFNWRPNAFRLGNKPSYTLKNQTDQGVDTEGRIMTAIMEGAFDKQPRAQFILEGKYEVGGKKSVEQNIKILDFEILYKNELENATKKA